jgi:hypothetical protein
MFTARISQEALETTRAKPIADGQQPMISADVVSMVHRLSQFKAPSEASGNSLFWKNVGVWTSSTTSAKRMLREQLVADQESFAALAEQVDELKRKTEKTEREFEEFKRQRQEEFNKLHEDIMRITYSGNSQSSTPVGLVQ